MININLKQYYDNLNVFLRFNNTQKILLDQLVDATNNGTTVQSDYVELKCKNLANRSSGFIQAYKRDLDNLKSFSSTIKVDDAKNELFSKFCEVYNVSGKFEDYFDKFHITFMPFKKAKDLFENNIVTNNLSGDMRRLLGLYDSYFLTLQYKTIADACERIFNLHEQDFTNEGYKTIFYGKTSDNQVLKLSKEQVLGLLKKAGYFKKISEKEYEKAHKNMVKSNVEDDKLDNFEKLRKERDLSDILFANAVMLKERLDAVNSPIYDSVALYQQMKVDRLAGVTPLKIPKQNWIYATALEIDLINYLLQRHGEEYSFSGSLASSEYVGIENI